MPIFKDILDTIKDGEFSGEMLDLTPRVCKQKLTDPDVIALAAVLKSYPRIKKVNLSYNNITDSGAEAIAMVTTVEELDFSNDLPGYDEAPNIITGRGAAALAKANLKKLILSGNPVGDAGISALAFSKTLLVLDLRDCAVTGAGVSAFFLNNTHVLNLNLASNQVYSGCLEMIAMNHVIQALDLSYCFINSSGAEFLSRNDSLVELQLANNDVGASGVQALAGHPRLRILNLYECNLDDSAMPGFATNTTLTDLNLSSNRMTTQGLEFLCQNKTLRILDLSRNDIEFGANELTHLAGMPSLTHICARNNRLNSEINQESFLRYFGTSTSVEVADCIIYCELTH